MLFIDFERHVDRLAASHRTNLKSATLEAWFPEFERFLERDLAEACQSLLLIEKFPTLYQLKTATAAAWRRSQRRVDAQESYLDDDDEGPTPFGRACLKVFSKFYSEPSKWDRVRLTRLLARLAKSHKVKLTIPFESDPETAREVFASWVDFRRKTDVAALGGIKHQRGRS